MSTHFLLLRSKQGEIIDICGHICETPENVKERLKNLNFRCLYKIHMCLCVCVGRDVTTKTIENSATNLRVGRTW